VTDEPTQTPEPEASEPELTEAEVSEQMGVRLAKRERLIASGAEAYPVQLPITSTIAEVRATYGHLEASEESGEFAAIAGRVVFQRNTGRLCFATIQAGDGQLHSQI